MRLQTRLDRLEGANKHRCTEEYTFVTVRQFSNPELPPDNYVGAFTEEKGSYVSLSKPYPTTQENAQAALTAALKQKTEKRGAE